VRFSERVRDIRLVRGETFFKVQHDAVRPFRVHTRDAVIQAVGTQVVAQLVDGHAEDIPLRVLDLVKGLGLQHPQQGVLRQVLGMRLHADAPRKELHQRGLEPGKQLPARIPFGESSDIRWQLGTEHHGPSRPDGITHARGPEEGREIFPETWRISGMGGSVVDARLSARRIGTARDCFLPQRPPGGP
jgi:hypothetical protein